MTVETRLAVANRGRVQAGLAARSGTDLVGEIRIGEAKVTIEDAAGLVEGQDRVAATIGADRVPAAELVGRARGAARIEKAGQGIRGHDRVARTPTGANGPIGVGWRAVARLGSTPLVDVPVE